MTRKIIRNARIVSNNEILEGYSLIIENGKIAEITIDKTDTSDNATEIIDAQNMYLAPGFIDLHIHGTENFLIDNGPDDLANLCKVLPKYGVTSFLPTVCPRPKGQDADFLASLATVKSQGSQILGFHLEGPFLAITGALPPEALGSSDPQRVIDLKKSARPFPAIFSISPEFENITSLIEIMSEDNLPVFITHTKANVKQTQAAINAGARHATHFYDVFYPPDEYDPGVRPAGVVEAVLADPTVSVDFILDGEHVDPIVVKMALCCKGYDKVCLITDANIGAGLKPGKYKFGNETVEFRYKGGPARFSEEAKQPGALAGSGLTMNLALKNAIKFLGLDIPQAIKLTSTSPANVIGLDNHKGKIEIGYDADLIIFDESISIKFTFVNGNIVHKAI